MYRVFKSSIGLALIVLMAFGPLAAYIPKVEASYTYINDPTFAQMGWMDVKSVGWDFNPGELLLTVKYQTNIPNNPNYQFYGNFYLDTDKNPATGSPSDAGAEYFAYYRFSGDASSSYAELYHYDSGLGYFTYVKDLLAPTGSAGGDTVELGVPLSDIGSPTGINIHLNGAGGVDDFLQKAYTYKTGMGTSITVDGNPSDWGTTPPNITDPTGDASPSFADVTNLYTTDGSGKLYFRIDFAAAPLTAHPEANSTLETDGAIYLDTDHNPSTGASIGGIGADYELYTDFYMYHAAGSRYAGVGLDHWSGTDWTYVSSATLSVAVNTVFELSALLSDLGVAAGSTIGIYVGYVYTYNHDMVPNSGTFTATKGPNPPSKSLSAVAAQVLSASTNKVYFLYADPNRMVSQNGPWNAGFAAYDATASGFIYGLCTNPQNLVYDSDSTAVVAKNNNYYANFNYGQVLLSGKTLVFSGGPSANWAVNYYERSGQSPLKFYVSATDAGFQTQAGKVAFSLPLSTDWAHNDLFVVEVFQDINGNFVFLIYGLNWKGTFAGGLYFKDVMKSKLSTYTAGAYVFKWADAGSMDGIPQASEITQQYHN